MKLQVIGTGSKGNSYALHAGEEILLLDAGLPYKEILKALSYDTSKVIGCLVTHEHQDHSKACKDILKAGIGCYMSNGTQEALQIENWDCISVEGKKTFKIGSFDVMPFSTEHDAAEPFGFFIRNNVTCEKLVYMTDTYYSKYTFDNVDYWIVECNYIDELMQSDTETPKALKNRLLESHMSLNRLVDMFKANNTKLASKIVLVHLSESRSDEKFMCHTIASVTNTPCMAASNGIMIELERYPF